jgi:hypothetical protein
MATLIAALLLLASAVPQQAMAQETGLEPPAPSEEKVVLESPHKEYLLAEELRLKIRYWGRVKAAGVGMTSVGIVALLAGGGIALSFASTRSADRTGTIVVSIVAISGAVFTAIGIPLWVAGGARLAACRRKLETLAYPELALADRTLSF